MATEIVRMIVERKLEERVIVSAFDAPDNAVDSNANWVELEQFGSLPTALLCKKSTLERIGCDDLSMRSASTGRMQSTQRRIL